MQKYTSKNTSINSIKLPAVYGKLDWDVMGECGFRILDYGCGKYTSHLKEFAASKGCSLFCYDPYNLPYSRIPDVELDVAICSNVLNVIDDLDTIKGIIRELSDLVPITYITVYEGDKSGIGKVTKDDCYQRNEKINCYLDLIKEMGLNVSKKNGVITIYKG